MKRLAAVGLLVLASCSSGYSEETRENFLAACHLTSGGEDGRCECILGEIEDRMSEEEFTQLESEGTSSVLGDSRIQEAAEECS